MLLLFLSRIYMALLSIIRTQIVSLISWEAYKSGKQVQTKA